MLAKIWNFNGWTPETDKRTLVDICDKALKDAGFNILAETEHDFIPQGFTKLYLLGESHFAIHTFPEHGKSYIELSSCNENMYIKCVEVLKKILKID
jgi:S-adenosylmethionine/arginine decarboxylase-like enzyme